MDNLQGPLQSSGAGMYFAATAMDALATDPGPANIVMHHRPTIIQTVEVSSPQTDSEDPKIFVKQEPPSSPLAVETSSTQDSSMSDSSFQAADSNSPKQSFVPCKVCGDKASGYHYGVTSCEGCKGFFRRSIQKQIEYRCLRDGKCMVIRLNRNRCQYCRFKKCLAVGMSRDSVRYGRVPKRSKSLDEQKVTTTEGSQDLTVAESKQLAIYDIILTISQAHHANCAYTEDKIRTLVKTKVSLLPKLETQESSSFPELLEKQRLGAFENLANLITPSIQKVVEFAKRVPGFHDLSQDDQLILIKLGFFEIWLSRLTRMFSPTENVITFGDGSVIPRDHLELVLTPELISAMYEFSIGFCQLRLTDADIGLFTGVVLATADRPGLTDTKAVEKIQDKLSEALKLHVSRNHQAEPNLFANVLMRLPELRTLGSKHADLLQWYRQRWKSLHLPPLFSEIFDIPKPEDNV